MKTRGEALSAIMRAVIRPDCAMRAAGLRIRALRVESRPRDSSARSPQRPMEGRPVERQCAHVPAEHPRIAHAQSRTACPWRVCLPMESRARPVESGPWAPLRPVEGRRAIPAASLRSIRVHREPLRRRAAGIAWAAGCRCSEGAGSLLAVLGAGKGMRRGGGSVGRQHEDVLPQDILVRTRFGPKRWLLPLAAAG
jgi:hypothetical protein